MLDSLTNLGSTGAMTLPGLVLCTLASLLLGLGVAVLYMYRNEYTKNFVVTVALLPAMVQLVIMVVNGNLGVGVAVMGAFSLVRFRSIPGTAREIATIFLAMAVGLATGMGYLAVAAVFLVVVGGASLVLNSTPFGQGRAERLDLKITIPENLDYAGLFDDLFARYTKGAELVRVKTTAMGSLFELHYRVAPAGPTIDKAFIDEL
ncbi:MAG: DUF4956 domain-containing protein, partial [Syntrophomonadaceae bacterium]|nr:DUF4956 domain-containing protein [Syntrophomonadaceae bacterium]